ncbi:MAG: hypothetical protein M1463_01635 [Candidatus Thermoplasmatota archaeon]|jgi:hypothetical protein|nr:hypothetical protein [Candidatus Thermoplasmatota archaeon]
MDDQDREKTKRVPLIVDSLWFLIRNVSMFVLRERKAFFMASSVCIYSGTPNLNNHPCIPGGIFQAEFHTLAEYWISLVQDRIVRSIHGLLCL